jgi:hypothetical protein
VISPTSSDADIRLKVALPKGALTGPVARPVGNSRHVVPKAATAPCLSAQSASHPRRFVRSFPRISPSRYGGGTTSAYQTVSGLMN